MPRTHFEFPLGIEIWARELADCRRRLREGYNYGLLENSRDSYRFAAMVAAERVAEIFGDVTRCIPDEAFLILEFYQEEMGQSSNPSEPIAPTVYYSPYMPTAEILETLRPYLPRLIHDGFVGFGLANNRAGFELFYSEEKVLTCFTGNHIRFMDMMSRHSIPFREDLCCPSDFGHDHLSLLCHPRHRLPEPFASMPESELDYVQFCSEITEMLEMYPVEEDVSFFLSGKEQDLLEERLRQNPEFEIYSEEDFGNLLLDWVDFVRECAEAFQGGLDEYRQGLQLRDVIQFAIEGVPVDQGVKIQGIVAEADSQFTRILIDRRKRLDTPVSSASTEEPFWHRGMVCNPGAYLRRDLIRNGWFKP